MIATIREMAEKMEELRATYSMTAEYLQACNLLFENGILSHEKIGSISSKPLINMAEGMKWFIKWKEELQNEPGIVNSYNLCSISKTSVFFSSQILNLEVLYKGCFSPGRYIIIIAILILDDYNYFI